MPDRSQLRGLYAITDETLIPKKKFTHTVEKTLQGSARIIQYRDKSCDKSKRLQQASELQTLCKKYNALLIINDDIELAQLVKADGVHLGKDDNSISTARSLLGEHAIIGISCYNQINLAIEAEKEGADYVAFGAIFSSDTKPDAQKASLRLLTEAKQQLTIPLCAIGGIDSSNAKQVFDAGADMAAVISALFAHSQVKTVSQQITDLMLTKSN
jgi:thiamine-phosphate pyrophosphorylase